MRFRKRTSEIAVATRRVSLTRWALTVAGLSLPLLIVVGLGGSLYLSAQHAPAAGSGDSSVWNDWGFAVTAGSYLFVTLSYSMYFKHVVLLDVMFISTGFLLRAVAGAAVIPVASSAWFLICTAFGALFLNHHCKIFISFIN